MNPPVPAPLSACPPPTSRTSAAVVRGVHRGRGWRLLGCLVGLLATGCVTPPLSSDPGQLRDADRDGITAADGDCDDTDPSVYPDAPESCNERDDDCDGEVDEDSQPWFVDEDEDGFGDGTQDPIESCLQPEGTAPQAGDCDDLDPASYPEAPELCDGLDNDCDDVIDNDPELLDWYPDTDGDGHGDPDGVPVQSCEPVEGHAVPADDCDDQDPGSYPEAIEFCDEVDNDCDGMVDEDLALETWYRDIDGDTYGDPSSRLDRCTAPTGWVANGTDCDDTSALIFPGADELCDGLDNDCDRTPDNDIVEALWWPDGDRDGYGDTGVEAVSDCAPLAGHVTNGLDCQDTDAAAFPGATERCNGIDDNCNSTVDEGVDFLSQWPDDDGDSYGTGSAIAACTLLPGYAARDGDCDDAAALVHPEAPELCDSVDNDCDDVVDEDVAPVDWFPDADGDAAGDGDAAPESTCSPLPELRPNADDCDDSDPTVGPAAPELCDGIDNDCDGVIDDGLATTDWYQDVDVDGFGSGAPVAACAAPAGLVANDYDCDDADPWSHPGAPELCDGLDNNCNGTADDGATELDWYPDADADGAGDPESLPNTSCSVVLGHAPNADDCDDEDPLVGPRADEICDGDDDDCDGLIDEGLAILSWWPDVDGDGWGDGLVSPLASCTAPPGSASRGGDCADGSAAIFPDAPELCDGLDNDCDGAADEDGACSGACWDTDLGSTVDGPDAVVALDPASGSLWEPGCLPAAGAPDHAFRFTAPADGRYRFTASSADFAASLSVVDGCGGAELACNASLDPADSSAGVSLELAGGQELILVLDGEDAASAGSASLAVSSWACPDGEIDATTPAMMDSLAFAYDDRDSSCSAEGAPERSYLWTPPADGLWQVLFTEVLFSPVLSIYEAGCEGAEIACAEGGSISFSATGGVPYLIVVEGASTDEIGDFSLLIQPAAPPP